MEHTLLHEMMIAERTGDKEYLEVLREGDFTRVEKDKAQPVRDKWAMQHIERILRSTL